MFTETTADHAAGRSGLKRDGERGRSRANYRADHIDDLCRRSWQNAGDKNGVVEGIGLGELRKGRRLVSGGRIARDFVGAGGGLGLSVCSIVAFVAPQQACGGLREKAPGFGVDFLTDSRPGEPPTHG